MMANNRIIFSVSGLDCAEEVAVLRRELGSIIGDPSKLSFDVLNGRMIVDDKSETITVETIKSAVARTGMTASVVDNTAQFKDPLDQRRHKLQMGFAAISGVCIVAGVTLHVLLSGGLRDAALLFAAHSNAQVPLPEIVAYALSVLFGGRYVVVKAWYALRTLRADMNLLMVIAVIGAIIIGEWFEAATVSFLFALSLVLESWSVSRARRAVAELFDLTPTTACVISESGAERKVDVQDVLVGSKFIVLPGERMPLDGLVLSGESTVNQAPITGESIAIFKETGSEVFAGTINGEGALEIESTTTANDTTLARITRLIEDAQNQKANIEQWVEKFARYYTPAVILLAIGVFLVPTVILGLSWEVWGYRALVLLVIACPCALVISTPVSIVAGLASAARQGVLIKGGIYLELPAKLCAIAFDKTGTLTQGTPAVQNICPFDNHTATELLSTAFALERRSEHPLAKALTAYAQGQGLSTSPAEQVRSLPGKGVEGLVGDVRYWLGSNRFAMERGQTTPETDAIAGKFEASGQTVIAIGNDDHICGLITFADEVRPEARRAMEQIRSLGIKRVIMLTGDNRATAEAIAGRIGIDDFRAELLPADKLKAIEQMATTDGPIAMIGDGINDAPALARADLGIAMGAIGSDAAIETADIALMSDDLSRLPWMIEHSKRAITIIRQNIIFALAVKLCVTILAFGGFVSLWAAIGADVGASLLVVTNALRLLQSKDRDYGFKNSEDDTDSLVAGKMSHGH